MYSHWLNILIHIETWGTYIIYACTHPPKCIQHTHTHALNIQIYIETWNKYNIHTHAHMHTYPQMCVQHTHIHLHTCMHHTCIKYGNNYSEHLPSHNFSLKTPIQLTCALSEAPETDYPARIRKIKPMFSKWNCQWIANVQSSKRKPNKGIFKLWNKPLDPILMV